MDGTPLNYNARSIGSRARPLPRSPGKIRRECVIKSRNWDYSAGAITRPKSPEGEGVGARECSLVRHLSNRRAYEDVHLSGRKELHARV